MTELQLLGISWFSVYLHHQLGFLCCVINISFYLLWKFFHLIPYVTIYSPWFFLQFRTHKVIYRRYAGLFFSLCVDITDNELAYLECIHLFVEILDHFFSNVCELDLVFNFHKVCVTCYFQDFHSFLVVFVPTFNLLAPFCDLFSCLSYCLAGTAFSSA